LLTPDGRRAVTTLADGTGLVWDISTFPAEPMIRTAGEKDISGWWADLAAEDAGKAHAAAWRLADAPAAVVVPVLARHLRPVALDGEVIRRAVAVLDNESFAAREGAAKRLEGMGGAVVPDLRRALVKSDSAEQRRRLEGLIEQLSGPISTPNGLRRLRAIGVLERLATRDARKLLAELADGPVHPREARAARAAVDRLK